MTHTGKEMYIASIIICAPSVQPLCSYLLGEIAKYSFYYNVKHSSMQYVCELKHCVSNILYKGEFVKRRENVCYTIGRTCTVSPLLHFLFLFCQFLVHFHFIEILHEHHRCCFSLQYIYILIYLYIYNSTCVVVMLLNILV